VVLLYALGVLVRRGRRTHVDVTAESRSSLEWACCEVGSPGADLPFLCERARTTVRGISRDSSPAIPVNEI